ncbi:MAG: aminotransferase class V-fold PLP-dependent enzyme [Gemmatimonadota bacterium]
MTSDPCLVSPALCEREFALIGDDAYLNHAASAPLPRRSADALRAYAEDRQQLCHLYQNGTFDFDVTQLRGKLARLINAAPQSIGFVATTSDGIALALNGVDWQPGDNVVMPANEYPSVRYACEHLARRGVELREGATPSGHLDLDTLFAAVNDRTRALTVSFVHWHTGYRADLARIGEFCRQRGIISIVDGIQGLGACPVDVAAMPIDVLVAGTYKWLLGIPGSAVLYVAPDALGSVTPDRAGRASMATSVHATPAFVWHEDVMRYGPGAPPDPPLLVLEPSVDLLLEVGVGAIHSHTVELTDYAAAELAGRGFTLNTNLEAEHRSSILSFTTGTADGDETLTRSLVAQSVIVAKRGPGIRVSPHFHNSVADIDRLLEALP